MADRVIVAAFNSQNAAYDAAREIQNLDRDDVIKIKRGAIATKDDKGNLSIPDTKSIGSAWGLLGGTVIGGLLGLLLGPAGALMGASFGALGGSAVDLTNVGVREDFIRTVGSEIMPNETVLLMEVDEGSSDSVDNILLRRGGRAYRTDI